MAIDDILKTLEAQAQADCDDCIAEARRHAQHILDEAGHEATTIREKQTQAVERMAQTKAAQLVNSARLESKMRVSAVKGDGLESVYEAAERELRNVRERADYADLLGGLIGEAMQDTSGRAILRVSETDVSLAQRIVSERGLSAEVVGDPSIVGGALVELDQGRILRRNTLEDRLQRAQELAQDDVAKVLLA